jgi:hypothetical protein
VKAVIGRLVSVPQDAGGLCHSNGSASRFAG